MHKLQKRIFFAILRRMSIVSIAEKKDATTEMSTLMSNVGIPSTITSPKVAAKTAGILIKNEILNASSPEKPIIKSADEVKPDLETPGITETPWINPMIIPSFISRE